MPAQYSTLQNRQIYLTIHFDVSRGERLFRYRRIISSRQLNEPKTMVTLYCVPFHLSLPHFLFFQFYLNIEKTTPDKLKSVAHERFQKNIPAPTGEHLRTTKSTRKSVVLIGWKHFRCQKNLTMYLRCWSSNEYDGLSVRCPSDVFQTSLIILNVWLPLGWRWTWHIYYPHCNSQLHIPSQKFPQNRGAGTGEQQDMDNGIWWSRRLPVLWQCTSMVRSSSSSKEWKGSLV